MAIAGCPSPRIVWAGRWPCERRNGSSSCPTRGTVRGLGPPDRRPPAAGPPPGCRRGRGSRFEVSPVAARLRGGCRRGVAVITPDSPAIAWRCPRTRAHVSWQHVVGEFESTGWVTLRRATARGASNRVRAAIERVSRVPCRRLGAVHRPGDRRRPRPAAGDDRALPRARTVASHRRLRSERSFRPRRGGSAAARLRPWWRWVVTIGADRLVRGLTRFEPSILRAGAMAALSATAFALGRERRRSACSASPSRCWCWSTRCSCGRSGSGCRSAPQRACARSGHGWRSACRCSACWPRRSGSRSAPSSASPCRACWCSVACRWSASRPTCWPFRSPGFVMLYGLPAGSSPGSCRPLPAS